ncbi:unnamed protein product [Boreogadus saida]
MILECETRQTRKPVGGGINIQEQEEEEWRRKSVKSGIGLRSEQAAMDVQLRGNPPHSYGVSRTSIPQDNKNLQQLEQECLQFFESTIDSLEESFEDGEEQSQQAPTLASAPSSSLMPVRSSSPGAPSPLQTRTPNPRDNDIIDLVRPEPDLVPTKEAFFNPAMPDFQSLAAIPSSHQDMKPRQEPGDVKASEYNPPLPSGSSYRTPDGRSSYCPPGCVPTPVLIAQKLAENQGGTTSNIGPSSLHHRKSFESDKPTSLAEHTVKHGPPTSSKPTRFPANINVVHSNKEANQTNVNIHERQAQMLANLPGPSQCPGQEEVPPPAPQKGSNPPSRSVSFRDPTPSKSRMEALSKLGLRGRTRSGGEALHVTPQSPTSVASAPHLPKDLESSMSVPAVQRPSRPAASEIKPDRKADTVPADFISSSKDHPVHVKPSPVEEVPRSSYHRVPVESKPPPVSQAPEVPSFDFNSYGGKTVVINPTVPTKGDNLPAPDSPNGRAPHSRAGNNAYGGKSTVMSPRLPRSDLPDILSAHHINQSLPLPPPPTAQELNSYGGRTVTINPSAGSSPQARPARASAPSTAPKPLRHSSSGNLHRPRATSPEARRKSTTSKPAAAFRAQGITVQFSGKGAMDDSRRAALRKLGLMK